MKVHEHGFTRAMIALTAGPDVYALPDWAWQVNADMVYTVIGRAELEGKFGPMEACQAKAIQLELERRLRAKLVPSIVTGD